MALRLLMSTYMTPPSKLPLLPAALSIAFALAACDTGAPPPGAGAGDKEDALGNREVVFDRPGEPVYLSEGEQRVSSQLLTIDDSLAIFEVADLRTTYDGTEISIGIDVDDGDVPSELVDQGEDWNSMYGIQVETWDEEEQAWKLLTPKNQRGIWYWRSLLIEAQGNPRDPDGRVIGTCHEAGWKSSWGGVDTFSDDRHILVGTKLRFTVVPTWNWGDFDTGLYETTLWHSINE